MCLAHQIKKKGVRVPAESVSEKAIWQALVTAPKIDALSGQSVLEDWVLENASKPIALTEWNLNTWFAGEARAAQPKNRFLAYGLGAASYLHAILRRSDQIQIANQSMLAGTGWGITGIRIDTTEQLRPRMFPTAMVTGLYSRHHGSQLMELKARDVVYFEQPLRLTNIMSAKRVAEQDIVATACKDYYYLHVLSRSFDKERQIRINFPDRVGAVYQHWLLSDRVNGAKSPYAAIEELEGTAAGKDVVVTLPPRSVSVFRFKKKP